MNTSLGYKVTLSELPEIRLRLFKRPEKKLTRQNHKPMPTQDTYTAKFGLAVTNVTKYWHNHQQGSNFTFRYEKTQLSKHTQKKNLLKHINKLP